MSIIIVQLLHITSLKTAACGMNIPLRENDDFSQPKVIADCPPFVSMNVYRARSLHSYSICELLQPLENPLFLHPG